MDYGLVQLLVSTAIAIGSAVGFMEMRISRMYQELKEKIEDKQLLNQTVQKDLKDQIVRLEAKIDMLIQLNIKRADDKD